MSMKAFSSELSGKVQKMRLAIAVTNIGGKQVGGKNFYSKYKRDVGMVLSPKL